MSTALGGGRGHEKEVGRGREGAWEGSRERGGREGGGGVAREHARGVAGGGGAVKAEEAAKAVINVATDVMDGTGGGERGRVRAVWGEKGGTEEWVLRRVRASTAR